MRSYILKLQRRALSWLLARFGLVAIPVDDYDAARVAALDAFAFCQHSGFLRDGRYPGGRHAERKLKSKLADVIRLDEWRDMNG